MHRNPKFTDWLSWMKTRHWLRLVAIILLLALLLSPLPAAGQVGTLYKTDLPTPANSGNFGKQVEVLPNGNIVVADPAFSTASAPNAGAVYLYDGETLGLISVLTGSHANDAVGSGDPISTGPYPVRGIHVLSSGDFVVISPGWNGTRGAVTQVNGTTGLSGVVSEANSLVGSVRCDAVGLNGITELPNGSYVITSPLWDNDPDCWYSPSQGASTWVNPTSGTSGLISASNSLTGVGPGTVTVLTNGNYLVSGNNSLTWNSATGGKTGAVSSANSLVGSHPFDSIGNKVIALSNGNYVTWSAVWDNGATQDAGAVTWGNGATGTSGVVSIANSLVGTRVDDNVSNAGNWPGVVALANGNYVVISYLWDSPTTPNVGAVTWGNGATGRTGAVSALNSLVGSSATDWLGLGGVTPLSNGNYVISSPNWNSARGAVTWGNGASGITGTISAGNSLVGSVLYESIGSGGVVALPNGNYLVRSSKWNQDRGAVTWGDGSTGVKGEISSANSLVGGTAYDKVGSHGYDHEPNGVTVLSNGNYVVSSPHWQIEWGQPVGAVTWGSGSTGATGVVSAANSLIGSSVGDKIGMLREFPSPTVDGIIPLSDGSYLVASGYWDHGSTPDVGAITWMNGSQPASGVVTAANSLVGSSANNRIGAPHDSAAANGIMELSSGKIVVTSPYWDNGAVQDAGAVTLIDGAGSFSGNVVTAANSLVGSFTSDFVGSHGVIELPNGHFLVRSGFWNNLTAGKIEAGALTWGSGVTGITGAVSETNSLVGGSDLDRVGLEPPTILGSSDYVVFSPLWDNGVFLDAGAVTWGSGTAGTSGLISNSSSVLGLADNQGSSMSFRAALGDQRLVIGRDLSNIVTIVELLPRLIVAKTGSGSGTVTSSPPGIDCGDDCTHLFNPDTLVTLAATPAAGSTFSGWSGACSGMVVCIITMDQVQSVIASFTADTHSLSVNLGGSGTGTVTSSPAGINCGSDCTETYDYGTTVTLTAAPAAGSVFTGWSGACSGTGDCILNMNGNKSVTATFTQAAPTSYLLSVLLAGSGSGTVTSSPAGINCGADCTESYTANTLVTLAAAPAAGSVFAGWSGACSGTGTCQVTMNSAKNVAATFNLSAASYSLAVSLAGSGSGTVTSSPAGINCGADCTESYTANTLVTLAAAPAAGSVFAGWSGACSGTGTCQVTMNSAKNVAATFNLSAVSYSLVVSLAGSGSGTVTSDPAGINCGADCTESYTANTLVTLAAAPAAGSVFGGWSGACSGTGTCQVTMNSAKNVTASFRTEAGVSLYLPMVHGP